MSNINAPTGSILPVDEDEDFLTGEQEMNTPKTRPMFQMERYEDRSLEDQSRAPTYDADSRRLFEAEEGGISGAVSRSFFHGGNIAYNLYRDYHRKTENGPADPAWNDEAKNGFIKDNISTIGIEQAWRFWGTKNNAEAQELLSDMQGDQRAMRIQGELGMGTQLFAGFVAGMVDVDAPITFLSGGLGAAAKAGINATRAGRLASGIASGALLGTGMGALDYQVNPNAEATDIALFGVMGAGFGLMGGALSRGAAQDVAAPVARNVQEEIGENVTYGYNRTVDAQSGARHWDVSEASPETPVAGAPDAASPSGVGVDPDEAIATDGAGTREPRAFSTPGSAGAAGVPGAGIQRTGTGQVSGTQNQAIIQQAKARDRQLGVSDEWYDPEFNISNAVTEAAGRAARRFAQVAQKIGVGSDHGKLMNTAGSVGKMLAYDLLESPSGIARNHSSAAILRETYRTEMAGALQPYYEAMKEWKAAQGYTWRDDWWPVDVTGKTGSERFNEAVIEEIMSRGQFGGKGTSDPVVRKAADAWQRMHELDIEIGQGRGSEIGMDAYAGMKKDAGYVGQQWSGIKMRKMIDDAQKMSAQGGAQMKAKLVRALREEYALQYPNLDPKALKKVASAVLDRALTNNAAISRNLLTLLNGDEAPFIRSRLKAEGLSDQSIDRLLDGMTGARAEKGKPNHTKGRYAVDFRNVSSEGIRLMDMLDTDLHSMAHRRIAKTSGLGALARKGITSREKYEQIKAAALEEQNALGRQVFEDGRDPMTRATDFLEDESVANAQFFDDIYTYFDGTPMAGGISPAYARIKKLTSLALMNQLGMTQLAEFGAVAAGVGIRNFMDHAGVMFKKAASDANSPLMQELNHFNIFVPEENVFRPDLAFEYEKLTNDGALGQAFDRVLNKATRLQGYTSAFYAVRGAQQKMVLSAGTARLFESIKAGGKGQWSDMRLKDMGVDLDLYEKLVNSGIPEFDANGKLVKMNFDQWDYDTQVNFRSSMHRLTGQLIQKAMAGESNVMFHRDGMAQLFWQFKSFPLLSVEKQFARNMRFADSTTLNTFMFGTITAGLAFSSRQLINGRTDRLGADDIVRGALNYSNMAGWIGMWVDPIAAMLGLEDYNMSGYSARGGGNIVSVPAAFGVLDKFGMLPGALAKVTGEGVGAAEYSNSDIRALQTIPLIGNAYGMSFLLNSLRKTGGRKAPAEEAAPVDETAGPVEAAPVVNAMLGLQ